MASFKAKISWEGTRKRKEKNRSNVFLPDPQYKIPKKLQKNYKTPSQLLFKPKQFGKGRERQKIKNKNKKKLV